MKSYNELSALVIAWAHQKEIFEKGNFLKQCEKTKEEVYELETAILNNDREETIDALGGFIPIFYFIL